MTNVRHLFGYAGNVELYEVEGVELEDALSRASDLLVELQNDSNPIVCDVTFTLDPVVLDSHGVWVVTLVMG